jgi:hypothetical protein
LAPVSSINDQALEIDRGDRHAEGASLPPDARRVPLLGLERLLGAGELPWARRADDGAAAAADADRPPDMDIRYGRGYG